MSRNNVKGYHFASSDTDETLSVIEGCLPKNLVEAAKVAVAKFGTKEALQKQKQQMYEKRKKPVKKKKKVKPTSFSSDTTYWLTNALNSIKLSLKL